MAQDVNVLVVFWSRTGVTEKLALAAALGAVQANANIRFRWLREAALPKDRVKYGSIASTTAGSTGVVA